MKLLTTLSASFLIALATVPLHAQQASYNTGDRLAQTKTKAATQGYQEISWETLVPKSWDPTKLFEGIDFDNFQDSDPRAMELLEKMRKAWDDAPADPKLHGTRIRIPAFLIPFEASKGQLKEFLLVPYFGACLHTPPPPANQIIHAVANKPLKEAEMMSAVWVSGTLEVQRSDTEYGMSSYRMKADLVKPYEMPR